MTGRRIITFGTYDLFHIGHLNILRRARALGDYLIVGVSTDELNRRKKSITPIFPQEERLEIIRSLKFVDEVFYEESLEQKREYILRHNADVLVMGDDWRGRFDEFTDICHVTYLPRTENISTTEIKEIIESKAQPAPPQTRLIPDAGTTAAPLRQKKSI